jgi:hypothetical protein
MGYIDFTKSISYTDFENTIRFFFDEIMALYNLVGSGPLNISTEVVEPSSIRFVLLTESDEQAKLLYNLTRDRIISIYGHQYKAELNLLDNSLIIILNEEPSG